MEDIRIAAAICRCPVGRTAHNLETVRRLARRAAAAGARIVCFPELNLSGYGSGDRLRAIAMPAPAAVSQPLAALAAETGALILAGLAVAAGNGRVGALHGVWWPDGRRAAYGKVHAGPPEREVLAPGDRVPVFDGPGLRFGLQLCYDAHFPELTTAMALAGAEAVFLPHASPRGTPVEKRASWLRHLTARAFDNGIFVIACNQVGDNGEGLVFPGVALVIGPDGNVLADRTVTREALLVVDLKAADLERVRGHRMRWFLPHRRPEVYGRVVVDRGEGNGV